MSRDRIPPPPPLGNRMPPMLVFHECEICRGLLEGPLEPHTLEVKMEGCTLADRRFRRFEFVCPECQIDIDGAIRETVKQLDRCRSEKVYRRAGVAEASPEATP